ncbi:E3 ubiquitin-protein ligase PRT1 isoform X1 [Primulina eburnea]|uniref:E3 ubiquitin-protein ligase PRT1 isoform X1 n=2 Tax=Primulina eburnea TaxID=1245227 RepID=UPI003C6C7398
MEFSDKFQEMANESDDDGSELIHEAFICCVCRDVLYKPVVLACGHISCFWCIHKSMSGLHKSRCPICRNRYYHFPSICQTLHLMLLKMYPVASERRGNQILEDEKLMGYFSPQLVVPTDKLQPVIQSPDSLQPCISRADLSPNPCSIGKEEIPGRMEQVGPDPVRLETGMPNLQSHKEDTLTTNVISVSDINMNPGNSNLITRKPVSADEVLCGSCKRVLFRPAVLNCGHVFCKCCIFPRTNEILMCEVCQNPHPGDIPKVCLEFDHFLEEQFPKEYGLRKGLQMKQEQFPRETPSACSSEADEKKIHFPLSSGEDPLMLWDASSKLHIGVGCDACGMYPIIGDRYKCKDCVEEIGYDLCKACYSTSSKLQGRFNQQHTSDHKFEILKSSTMHEMMLRLLRGQLQAISAFSDALRDDVGDSGNTTQILVNTNEDAENDTLISSSETEENQNDSQHHSTANF